MDNSSDKAEQADTASGTRFGANAPQISLPKGGGAVRGVGEKFSVNPSNGTASMSIPLGATPGRAGFGPQLSLTYDSGAGNGPFGYGWSLGLASIKRKTDKGLPRYNDGAGLAEADVFMISDAEDLVPLQNADGTPADMRIGSYMVRTYRPRIEGKFARIERWSDTASSAIYWRTISRDNVTSVYGRDAKSQITDGKHIFSWLICESRDDKGNAIVYEYAQENSLGIDPALCCERNRNDTTRGTHLYIRRILYGNRQSCLVQPDLTQAQWLFQLVFDYGEDYCEAVPTPAGETAQVLACATGPGVWPVRPDPFSSYRAGFEERTYRRCARTLMFHQFDELGSAPCLVRTNEFAYDDLDYTQAVAIDAELAHKGSTRFASFIRSVTQSGYLKNDSVPVQQKNGQTYQTYFKRPLPPVEFDYSQALIAGDIRQIAQDDDGNLPIGIDDKNYHWTDLDGEGLHGVLVQQGGAWFYKRNISALPAASAGSAPSTPDVRFAPVECLRQAPPPRLGQGLQLLDVSGSGMQDVVELDAQRPGYFERTTDGGWERFKEFSALPNIDWQDPNLRFIDVTGDGLADVLVTEDDAFTWYPSCGADGYGRAGKVQRALDEEKGPCVLFSDGTQSIYLADMSGDGLTDLVRIRNSEICYWPNLGYGRFGAKVTMDNAPLLDRSEDFSQSRLRLADLDGSGTTDLVYLAADGARLYFNQSGNSWSAPRLLAQFPRIDSMASVQVLDLFGNGTSCLTWSTPLGDAAARRMFYIDLMSGQKPHLLVSVKNNLGQQTDVEYAPSTRFYLADRYAGKPWITRLPFPVQCVAKMTVTDQWRQTAFATTYSYHHGHFDGSEREFRGFGRVEQTDVQSFGTFAAANSTSPYITADKTLYQPPVKTVTWYHTGAYLDQARILKRYEGEYFPNWLADLPGKPAVDAVFTEAVLPEPAITTPGLSADEWREALRACKGMVLRQEVMELDVNALAQGRDLPVRFYSAAQHNYRIVMLQPRGANQHAVFLTGESETLTYHYDLDLRAAQLQPDPRIEHSLNLSFDELGNVQQSVSAGYPRVRTFQNALLQQSQVNAVVAMQQERRLTYKEMRYTSDVIDTFDPAHPAMMQFYHLRRQYEVQSFELTGIAPASGFYYTVDDLRRYALSTLYPSPAAAPVAVPAIAFQQLPPDATPHSRPLDHSRTIFFKDDLSGALTLGTMGKLGLVYQELKLALTDDLLNTVLINAAGNMADQTVPGGGTVRVRLQDNSASGYLSGAALAQLFGVAAAGEYWIAGGVAGFAANAAQRFYQAERYTDAFGNQTTLAYDAAYNIYLQSSTDAKGNNTQVSQFDFRVMKPALMQDCNNNLSQVVFDILGLPAASALKGKGSEGDNLEAFTPAQTNPGPAALAAFFTGNYDAAIAQQFVAGAGTRHLNYFGETQAADGSTLWGQHPGAVCSIVREQHAAQLAAGAQSPLQTAFEYADGSGTVLVRKSQAEPAAGSAGLRWIASGKTIQNNKGKPVKRYEPYFSSNEHRYEESVETGVTSVIYYDAADKVVRTDNPDGSYSRADYSPWQLSSYDNNDTVLEPGNPWYAQMTSAGATTEQQRAAQLAAVHANTPSITIYDSLGRSVAAIAQNRQQYPGDAAPSAIQALFSMTKLDSQGRELWKRDARNNLVTQNIVPPMADGQAADAQAGYAPAYDMAGKLLFRHGMDDGERWTLVDALGKPLVTWDFNQSRDNKGVASDEQRQYYHRYDALHRPIEQWLTVNKNVPQMIVRTVYADTGGSLPNAQANNLCGHVVQLFDPCGLVQTNKMDFKGGILETQRQLTADYKAAVVDWQNASNATPDPNLDTETFYRITEYDALKRPTRLYNWHGGTGARVAVHEPHYNLRGLRQSEDLVIGAVKTAGGYTEGAGSTRTHAVADIEYDVKGQRQSLTLGNGSITRYQYDAQTFRLLQMRTTRPGFDPAFPEPAGQLSDAKVLQNLFYTYDAVGNVTQIRDDAFAPAYFANQMVDAQSQYTYDALYRLIASTGRENGAAAGAPVQIESAPGTASFPVTAANALRNYAQQYQYDDAGNITQMRHSAGSLGSWTRAYQYANTSNRLANTSTGDPLQAVTYQYDAHGNMLNVANVAASAYTLWDYRDMISAFNGIGGGWTYYNYDSAKQRTRKVNESLDGTQKQWERIDLGGLEIYRRYSAGNVVVQIESVHMMDGDKRQLLAENVLQSNDAGLPAGVLYRYQYGNHLGSAVLELDASAQVISYEETHPYGTAAYHCMQTGVEANPKRYRYTGMERDEESGLDYHGVRYYLPWLGRWSGCDPKGLADGMNLYAYCRANPLAYSDRAGTDSKPENPNSPPPPAPTPKSDSPQKYHWGGKLQDTPPVADNKARVPETPEDFAALKARIGPIFPDLRYSLDPTRALGPTDFQFKPKLDLTLRPDFTLPSGPPFLPTATPLADPQIPPDPSGTPWYAPLSGTTPSDPDRESPPAAGWKPRLEVLNFFAKKINTSWVDTSLALGLGVAHGTSTLGFGILSDKSGLNVSVSGNNPETSDPSYLISDIRHNNTLVDSTPVYRLEPDPSIGLNFRHFFRSGIELDISAGLSPRNLPGIGDLPSYVPYSPLTPHAAGALGSAADLLLSMSPMHYNYQLDAGKYWGVRVGVYNF